MQRLIYDIETNGLMRKPWEIDDGSFVSKVHCIVTRDIDTNEVCAYYDATDIASDHHRGSLLAGMDSLRACDLRAGHNVLNYDDPVLEFLGYGKLPDTGVRDTLIGARACYPDEHLKSMDYARMKQPNAVETKYIGRHSLEAWGQRLGCHKGQFGKQTDWKVFTKEMLDYCIRDTDVTKKLFLFIENRLNKGLFTTRAWTLEQSFAKIIEGQMAHGVLFDAAAADALTQELLVRRNEIAARITIAPFQDEYVTPKKKLKRIKYKPFNPNSRPHIARYLIATYQWTPLEFTPGGRPKVDDVALQPLSHVPEVATFIEFLMVEKRLSQLAEGKSSLLKAVKSDGRIHARVAHCAAVTGRCNTSAPPLNGIPRVMGEDGKPQAYGRQMRALFVVPKGYKMVGIDASGLELRMLAHWLEPYDAGAYIKLVTEGDVHTANKVAGGMPSRDMAKRFIYAFLYGAGDEKLGTIVGGGKTGGRKTKLTFLRNMGAVSKLKAWTERMSDKPGHVTAPDGRVIFTRYKHAAINTLLQGSGAMVMKAAVVILHRRAAHLDFHQVMMAHDEVQLEVNEAHAEELCRIGVEAIMEAGRALAIRCPLAGEAKTGNDWSETH